MAISCRIVKWVSCSGGHDQTGKNSSASLLEPVFSSLLQLLNLAILILFKLLVLAFKLLKLPGNLANSMLLRLKGQVSAGVAWLWSNKLVVKSILASLLKPIFSSLLQLLNPAILMLYELPGLAFKFLKLPLYGPSATVTSMESVVSMVSHYCLQAINVFYFDLLVPFTKSTASKILDYIRTTTLLGSHLKEVVASFLLLKDSFMTSVTDMFHHLYQTSSSFARSALATAKIEAVKLQESLTSFVQDVYHVLKESLRRRFAYQATLELLKLAKQKAVAALGKLGDVVVVQCLKLWVGYSNAMNMFCKNARKAMKICADGAVKAADVLCNFCVDVYEAIEELWMDSTTTAMERLRRFDRMRRVSEISAALGGRHVCVVGSCLLGLGLIAFVVWAHGRRRRTIQEGNRHDN